MPYSLEKATALLVRELNASPDSPLSHPKFQNLLLLPAGPVRDRIVQNVAEAASVTLRSMDLPPAPSDALHNQDGILEFSQTLRAAARTLHEQGGGLLVLNDLGRTSQVLQNVAVTCMSRAALKKAGLDRVHVLWTAEPDDVLPNNVANQVLPMALDLSPAQAHMKDHPSATATTVPHVRIPNLSTLVGHLPAVQARVERARPSHVHRAA